MTAIITIISNLLIEVTSELFPRPLSTARSLHSIAKHCHVRFDSDSNGFTTNEIELTSPQGFEQLSRCPPLNDHPVCYYTFDT